MRIALVAPLVSPIAQPYIGGAQALLADLALGLRKRGHKVTLFARAGSQIEGVQVENIAVPESVRPAAFFPSSSERIPNASFFTQANLFVEIFLQIQRRSYEFDLVHIHAFDWPAYMCSALLREIPVLHTLHLNALVPEINQMLHTLDKQGHPLTLIAVSQSCARSYADFTPIDHIVHNGLNIRAIPFRAQTTNNAPLLFAGRIAPEKGVEAAIEIAEKAASTLIIAGGIYDQDYYQQKIAPRVAQANARIIYLGQIEREEVWNIMSEAAGLLCPIAWDEPFGLTTIEAMATGTPVIAFRRGAMAEIINHGHTGFLIEPDDCTEAAAMVPHLREISRIRCRKHVEGNFTIDRMIGDYELIYRKAMAKRANMN